MIETRTRMALRFELPSCTTLPILDWLAFGTFTVHSFEKFDPVFTGYMSSFGIPLEMQTFATIY
jgi:hypothetical protein